MLDYDLYIRVSAKGLDSRPYVPLIPDITRSGASCRRRGRASINPILANASDLTGDGDVRVIISALQGLLLDNYLLRVVYICFF